MILEVIVTAGMLAPPSVGPMSLFEMVRDSDAVVVARVVASEELPLESGTRSWIGRGPLKLGRLEVEQWIKGAPTGSSLVFLNQGTWTCDITGAEVGERALWFLVRDGCDSSYRPHISGYDSTFGDAPLHRVLHSGRGQMNLRALGERSLVTVWRGSVILPEGAPWEVGPQPEYSFIPSIELGWLKGRIAGIIDTQRAVHLRAAAHSGAPGAPWELTLRWDRTASLRVRGPDGGLTRELALEACSLRNLDRALEAAIHLRELHELGEPGSSGLQRELTLHTPKGPFELRIGHLGAARTPPVAAFTSIWSAIEGLLPDPTCMHHSAR